MSRLKNKRKNIVIKKIIGMRFLTNIKFFSRLILLVLLATPHLALVAQQEDTLRLSLQQAVDYALEHNYQVINARADVNIAGRQVWEITADGLPQVSGSLGYQYFMDIPVSLVPADFIPGGNAGEFVEIQFGTEQNISASLTVSQLIFDGSYIVGLQASRIYRELAKQNYQRTEIEVKSTITETYYLNLSVQENLQIIRQNLRNLERSLHETERLFEQGFTDAINVDQLRLTVANLRNRVNALERQKKITADLLKFQTGIKINIPVVLTDKLDQLFSGLSLDSFLQNDFNPENHIDFKVMKSQEMMQLMAMRREWSFYLPSLSAFYTRQENAYRNQFNFFESGQPWFPTSIIGVTLNVPIFSSGLRRSRVQQARLELEKATNNTVMIEQSLILQLREANTQIQNALENYNSERENLNLARRILERTTIMHGEGLASSLELTQASDQLMTTQGNYINAMFEVLNARNKLNQALGID
jgi:outer membrane protein